MGLFSGKKTPVKGAPRKGQKVCIVHGVFREGVCGSRCVAQNDQASGLSDFRRAREESSGDPNSGW